MSDEKGEKFPITFEEFLYEEMLLKLDGIDKAMSRMIGETVRETAKEMSSTSKLDERITDNDAINQ